MKKIAIYVALMEEKKLQNLFLLMNCLVFGITFLFVILSLFISIPIILFVILGISAILLMLIQSHFILQVCEKYANQEFKRLFLKYLEIETYYHTAKKCKNFKKVKKNILIALLQNNKRKIKKGFAYLKEWQNENVIEYEF